MDVWVTVCQVIDLAEKRWNWENAITELPHVVMATCNAYVDVVTLRSKNWLYL